MTMNQYEVVECNHELQGSGTKGGGVDQQKENIEEQPWITLRKTLSGKKVQDFRYHKYFELWTLARQTLV